MFSNNICIDSIVSFKISTAVDSRFQGCSGVSYIPTILSFLGSQPCHLTKKKFLQTAWIFPTRSVKKYLKVKFLRAPSAVTQVASCTCVFSTLSTITIFCSCLFNFQNSTLMYFCLPLFIFLWHETTFSFSHSSFFLKI